MTSREKVIQEWSGAEGAKRSYPLSGGKWPDGDEINILREWCVGNVCEIGCGTGRCSEAFEPDKYVGLDINETALNQARQQYPNHKFIHIGFGDPYPDADTYLFYTVLLHIPDNELINVLWQTQSLDEKRRRVVIFETMGEHLRKEGVVYNRSVTDYFNLLEQIGKKPVATKRLSSNYSPYYKHYVVAE